MLYKTSLQSLTGNMTQMEVPYVKCLLRSLEP